MVKREMRRGEGVVLVEMAPLPFSIVCKATHLSLGLIWGFQHRERKDGEHGANLFMVETFLFYYFTNGSKNLITLLVALSANEGTNARLQCSPMMNTISVVRNGLHWVAGSLCIIPTGLIVSGLVPFSLNAKMQY